VPGRRQVRIDGIDVHSSLTLTDDDATTVDGIPCTSAARTIFELANVVPRRQVERAIDQAEVEQLLDLRRLNGVLERNRHTHGSQVIRAILAEYEIGPPTESELEEIMFAACRTADTPLPERQGCVDPGDGEPPIRGDFVWRQQRLIVETDGNRFHRTRAAFEADRRRDQPLMLAGWRVIRVTWRQLKFERGRITALIASALRQQA
jgi:Protein of unknown function (DUF559)